VDRPLSRRGVDVLKSKGINAVVHGHLHLFHGQRITLRKGMVNFECDGTLDINTRKKEGLNGAGAAVTRFCPEGLVMGISTDFPYVKVFDPGSVLNQKTDSDTPVLMVKCSKRK